MRYRVIAQVAAFAAALALVVLDSGELTEVYYLDLSTASVRDLQSIVG